MFIQLVLVQGASVNEAVLGAVDLFENTNKTLPHTILYIL